MFTEDLIAAADPGNRCTLCMAGENGFIHSFLTQPQQVTEGIFTARDNQQIRFTDQQRIGFITQADIRLGGKGIEIGEVGNVRQLNHHNIQHFLRFAVIFADL